MKKTITCLALALAAAPLAGCYTDGYESGGISWSSHPYAGWYDGHYGSIYDGYWGTDNFFYFRLDSQERNYRRDNRRHFRRGETPPGDRFRRFEGNSQPPRGSRPRNYPRGDGGGDHGRREGRP